MPKKNFIPMWQKIKDDYLEKIKNGTLPAGKTLPTEKAIMEEYNVSRITVVRAMNELAEAGYISRRRGSGSIVSGKNDLRFRKAANQNTNKTIALIVPVSVARDFRILNEVDSVAREHGYIISLYDSGKSLLREREILENLEVSVVSGIITFPIFSIENLSIYSRLYKEGIPIVFIDRALPGIDIPCVKCDNYSGGKMMTEYLIKKGHKKIAFFCAARAVGTEMERFCGYINALLENGLEPDNRYVIEMLKHHSDDSMLFADESEENMIIRRELYRMMNLPDPPTAVFCVNDITAVRVQQQALALGYSVPEDLSVIGFDNILADSEAYMTTCAQDFKKIGHTAISLILSMINGEPIPVVEDSPVELIERQSVLEIESKE